MPEPAKPTTLRGGYAAVSAAIRLMSCDHDITNRCEDCDETERATRAVAITASAAALAALDKEPTP